MKSRFLLLMAVMTSLMLAAPSGAFAADEEFKGKIGKTLADSEQHWPEPVAAPEDAPNVLIWLIDDMASVTPARLAA
ncbi:MAG: hypothetical protein KJN78_12970 [Gammaproteobacteria bacterium]|nr:hypothetical protein [Gammaproteobacteria bacterium]